VLQTYIDQKSSSYQGSLELISELLLKSRSSGGLFKSTLLVSRAKRALVVLSINSTEQAVHAFFQQAKGIEVWLKAKNGGAIGSFLRIGLDSSSTSYHDQKASYCKFISVSRQITSIVCQVAEIQRAVIYDVSLNSLEIGEIKTNTAIKMEVHQREQLDMSVDPEAIIVFKNLTSEHQDQFRFTFTLNNPNRLGLLSATLAHPAEKFKDSFSHCLLEGITAPIVAIYSNFYDVVAFQCDFTEALHNQEDSLSLFQVVLDNVSGLMEVQVIDTTGERVFSKEVKLVAYPAVLSIAPSTLVRNPSRWFDGSPVKVELQTEDQHLFSVFNVSVRVLNHTYPIKLEASKLYFEYGGS